MFIAGTVIDMDFPLGKLTVNEHSYWKSALKHSKTHWNPGMDGFIMRSWLRRKAIKHGLIIAIGISSINKTLNRNKDNTLSNITIYIYYIYV